MTGRAASWCRRAFVTRLSAAPLNNVAISKETENPVSAKCRAGERRLAPEKPHAVTGNRGGRGSIDQPARACLSAAIVIVATLEKVSDIAYGKMIWSR